MSKLGKAPAMDVVGKRVSCYSGYPQNKESLLKSSRGVAITKMRTDCI